MGTSYSPVIKKVAQWGLISKGVVYVIFGLLILMAVYGRNEEPVHLFGILKYILHLGWLGRVLVILLTIGLLCYAAWKLFQMILNIENYEKDLHGYFVRFTWLGPFLFYLTLGMHAAIELWNYYFGELGYSFESWRMQDLIYTGWGKYLIALMSFSLFVNAASLFYLAFSGKYTTMLTGERFHNDSPRFARITGFSGYFLYGLALLIISVLFAAALYYSDASLAKGEESMFEVLKSKPYGVILLMSIAIGTICYGIYFFSASFYRWRNVPVSGNTIRMDTGK